MRADPAPRTPALAPPTAGGYKHPAGYKPNAAGFYVSPQGSVDPNDPSVIAALQKGNPGTGPTTLAYGVAPDGTPIPGTTPQGPTPLSDPYDYSQDPILLKIKANDEKIRTDARDASLAARKAEAIRFGDASDQSDLDPTTASQASGNPYSVLAALKHGYDQTVHDHGETLNNDNLWYSGAHAKALTDDANAYGQQQYDARTAHQGILTGIGTALASALAGADTNDQTAEGDAATRATARAQATGTDPGTPQPNAVTRTDTPTTPDGTTTKGNTTTTTTSGAPSPRPAAVPQSKAFGGTTGPYIGTLPSKARALAAPKAPKLPNAYLSNPNKRG